MLLYVAENGLHQLLLDDDGGAAAAEWDYFDQITWRKRGMRVRKEQRGAAQEWHTRCR